MTPSRRCSSNACERAACSCAPIQRGDVRGLLFGVVRNVAARFEERALKRTRRNGATGSILDTIRAAEPSMSFLFDREWARALLRLAGDRMKADAQEKGPGARLRVELLRLRFGDGLPIRDIATQWDVDPESVHRAYAHGRAEFRRYLREVVAEHVVRAEDDLEREVARVFELLG